MTNLCKALLSAPACHIICSYYTSYSCPLRGNFCFPTGAHYIPPSSFFRALCPWLQGHGLVFAFAFFFFSADYILTAILQPLCTGSQCLCSRKHLLPVWLASTRIAHHPLGAMRNDVSESTRFPALPVYYKDPMGKRTNRLLRFISLWVISCSSLSSQLGYCSLCWASFSLGIVS